MEITVKVELGDKTIGVLKTLFGCSIAATSSANNFDPIPVYSPKPLKVVKEEEEIPEAEPEPKEVEKPKTRAQLKKEAKLAEEAAKVKEEDISEPEEEKTETPKEDAGVSLVELRDVASSKFIAKNKSGALMKLLKQFDAASISELEKKQYADFMQAMQDA